MEEINLDRSRGFNNNSNNLAVKITDAYKSYTSDEVILNKFNMNVKQGTIYSLLGPSGCGKTTLLSCIMGCSNLDSGHIQLSVKQKKDIGYMPQELALFDEFNMLESFHYFGSLYNMSYEDIKSKGEKLLSIMEMPPAKTLLSSMSGGQQRRFSLSIALLHDPSLLILDEPTVGLDSIISASIWQHLKDLSIRGKTIIITTHYIEEARLADMIGLMRKGVLVSEAPPLEVMASCNTDTLEKAFLILSEKQTTHDSVTEHQKPKPTHPATTSLEKSSIFSPIRFYAQMVRHWYWSKRNWRIILFVLVLPLVTILTYNLTTGKLPQSINIGIVNNEESSHCTYEPFDICDSNIPLSCKYVREMEKHNITLKFYNDIKSAREDLKYNSIWGYIKFEKNFTDAIQLRYKNPKSMSTEKITESLIRTSLDMSNFIYTKIIQNLLLNSYKDISEAFKSCNSSTTVTIINILPFKMMKPVYGSYELNVAQYGSIAIQSVSQLYLTFVFTSLSINMEINSGSIERSLAAGLTVAEIIASHLMVQTLIVVIQIIAMFILQFAIFQHTLMGSWIWPSIIVFLQGMCGSFFGFASCAAINDEVITTFFGVTLTIVLSFLSGVMWPVESMHPIIQNISMFLPLSSSISALRSMINKDWGLSHPTVIRGFVTILAWIFASLLFAILCLRIKKGFKSKNK